MTQEHDPQKLVQGLIEAGLSEANIVRKLNEQGVRVSQPTINRIKKGRQRTSFEVGSGLVRLARRYRSTRPDSALTA
jgi:hypothetical protein